jgi:hypothetical protein
MQTYITLHHIAKCKLIKRSCQMTIKIPIGTLVYGQAYIPEFQVL